MIFVLEDGESVEVFILAQTDLVGAVDITCPQLANGRDVGLEVLRHLGEHDSGRTVNEIANARKAGGIGCRRQEVEKALDRLEAAGAVEIEVRRGGKGKPSRLYRKTVPNRPEASTRLSGGEWVGQVGGVEVDSGHTSVKPGGKEQSR